MTIQLTVLASLLTVITCNPHYGPQPSAKYEFGYEVADPKTGDFKSQVESGDGVSVRGAYSLLESDGTKRVVEYADEGHGFTALVKKEAPIVPYPVASIPHPAPVSSPPDCNHGPNPVPDSKPSYGHGPNPGYGHGPNPVPGSNPGYVPSSVHGSGHGSGPPYGGPSHNYVPSPPYGQGPPYKPGRLYGPGPVYNRGVPYGPAYSSGYGTAYYGSRYGIGYRYGYGRGR